MGIFGVLGKVGKFVGKAALGTVGAVVGIDGLANVFDKKQPVTATAAAVPVQAEGTYVNANSTNGGILDSIVNSINRLNPRVTVDHTADITGSSFPAWVTPVAIGAAVLMLMRPNGRR